MQGEGTTLSKSVSCRERENGRHKYNPKTGTPHAADHLGYQSTDKEGAQDTNTWRPWNLLINNKLANNPWHGMHLLPD
jgi:hypothetical protein